MNWSRIWPLRWARGNKAPARRTPSTARLAVELLEDRLMPSTAGPSDAAYQLWRQQTVKVDDQAVATAPIHLNDSLVNSASVPANNSFGSLIGLPAAFTNYPYRGDGYSVAIIDTGIDYNNPNLGGGFGPGHKVIAGWNFVNNTANPMDDNGHGTHVAGIIGSTNATYSGVAPDVNLIALKVLDASGSGTFGNIQNALDWVVANQAKYHIVAINMSLGSGNYTVNPFTFLDNDFGTLKNDGVFISVAAGNSFYSNNSAVGLDFPAVDPLVVSVGAVYDANFGAVAWGSGARDFTTAADRVASFSQRGPALSIMAPGAMITSTYLHNTFQAMAGTSMAAPVIAGASVLIHQALDAQKQTANQDTILAIMKATGAKVVDGDDENDNVTNTGLSFKRIDVSAALASIGKAPAVPVLQPIGNQSVAPGGTLTIALNGSEVGGATLTYAAIVQGGTASQPYQLKQQLGLAYAGSYYLNAWGSNEKWLKGTGSKWYCLLPNGELRQFTGVMATTLQPASLIATLDTRFYADPSLLWNAQPGAATNPILSVVGHQLTVKAPASATGSYQIQVTVSDGKQTASQSFTVSIQTSATPQIATIPTQALLTNRSQTVTLSATDASKSAMTYSAKIVGTFTTAPASLAVTGSQLTIYSSPNYIGGFDVQVTASNGSKTASTTFHVNVAASSIAYRLTADFTGDGIQDTAFLNQDGSWWVSAPKSDGSFVNQSWGQWAAGSSWKLVQVGYFNGDSKADIVGFTTAGAWWVGASTGASFTSSVWAQWSAASNWNYVQAGDFNGDGKTDIVGFTNGGAWWVGASTGTTFNTTFWTQWTSASTWSSVYVQDVDGDGRVDIVGKNKAGKWFVGYAAGTQFNTQLWAASTPPAAKK